MEQGGFAIQKAENDGPSDWEIEVRVAGGTPIVLKPKSRPRGPELSDAVCAEYADAINKLALDVAEASVNGDAKAAAQAEHFLDLAIAGWERGGCRRLGSP